MARILVVDDESVVRIIMGRMLAEIGHEADLAEDGNEAAALSKNASDSGRPYELLILDLHMPTGMTCAETLAELRKINPSVAAILASGYPEDEIRDECLRLRADGCLEKPFTRESLESAINRLLSA